MQTPYWLKKRITLNDELLQTKRILSELGINTVCESSLCPNLNECFSRKTVTFMILGRSCTRGCRFCRVERSTPAGIDMNEPERIVEAVRRLGLKYIVITSVTRDDLKDGGAGQFVKTIEAIKASFAGIKIEVLIPDLKGDLPAVTKVLKASPDVFSHNIETVHRLYPALRPEADYDRSLAVLEYAKKISPGQMTKTALMVGLGETENEVLEAMKDIRRTGCDVLVIGQYLRPSAANAAVNRFVTPEEFGRYKQAGEGLGFGHVEAGPFVRSSYAADAIFKHMEEKDHDRCYSAAVS